jgi:hypothetical protein
MDSDDPANLAASALNCGPLDGAAKLYSHLRGHPTATSQDVQMASGEDGHSSTITLSLSIGDLQSCHDSALRATSAGGWDALESRLREHLGRAAPGSKVQRELTADHRRAAYVKTYVDAYFRNGHFLGVDLAVDEQTALARLTRELQKTPAACSAYNAGEAAAPQSASGSVTPSAGSASPCSALAQAIYRGVLGSQLGQGKSVQLVKIRSQGFQPRDGSAALMFPAIDVDVDPTRRPIVSLTYGEPTGSARFDSAFWLPVGIDLLRVLLAAVFDAHEGLPAVTGIATGLQVPDYPLANLADLENATNLQMNVDEMLRINQGTAAGVGVVLDRVVRGLGPFSLNNEALEQLIVTLITTSVEKAMEKATWCYYACDLNTAVEGAEREVEGKVDTYAREKTEKIRLRLKITK